MKLRELLADVTVLKATADMELEITHVAYDSRKVQEGGMFVAISGFATDGNRYIPEGERFADLCSGSGCIGISTLKNTRATLCDSYDISDGALALAEENAQRNGVRERITLIKRDLLRENTEDGYFAILSNPPYIPREVYESLDKEIFSEPRIAFVGGESGLIFYEKLIPVCKKSVKDGGFIAFEIGYDQADSLRRLAKENGLDCQIIKDYSGNDRVAILRK